MKLLRPRVYWPAMYREARDYIISYEQWTMGHAPVLHTTSSHLLASHPLEVLAIDFTKLETASDGRENFLVLTDVYSKFTQAIPTRNQEAGTVPRCWPTSGSSAMGYPRKSTVTRVGTLSLSW